MAYPEKFRRKLLAVMEKEELTIEEGAKRFDVGTASVSRWKLNPNPTLEIYSNHFTSISITYSHFELQNSSLFFQSKTIREYLKLLQNFIYQRFLLINKGL